VEDKGGVTAAGGGETKGSDTDWGGEKSWCAGLLKKRGPGHLRLERYARKEKEKGD